MVSVHAPQLEPGESSALNRWGMGSRLLEMLRRKVAAIQAKTRSLIAPQSELYDSETTLLKNFGSSPILAIRSDTRRAYCRVDIEARP